MPIASNRRGHGVGGVHAAAGARARAGVAHDVVPLRPVDGPGEVLAVALERGHDVHHFAGARPSRPDGAAVDHERGPVDPRQRHHHPRQVLVASGEDDRPVVPLPAHHRLDRIGDQIPGLEGEGHALGAHRHAVAHPDGVEAHPLEPRRLHPFLDRGGELQQMHVAVVALVPDAGDADLGLVEVFVPEPGGEELRLRSGLREGLGDARAVPVESLGHGAVLGVGAGAKCAHPPPPPVKDAPLPLRTPGDAPRPPAEARAPRRAGPGAAALLRGDVPSGRRRGVLTGARRGL